VANQIHSDTAELRYLDASQVEHPSGSMVGLTMCTEEDEKLGAFDGVLVEPASRRLRYFVVERQSVPTNRRYLLAADTPAVLEPTRRKLRVHAHAEDLERFDAREVRAFSDDDLIATMFACRA
jgi:hypothetical protein